MERLVDLHIHTAASDGSAPPADAVRTASELGLAAIAVTDHDTVSGVAEAMAAGAALGVEVVPGIEISADYQGSQAHILGLFIDPESAALRPALDWAVNEREERNRRMVAAMAADGFDISIDELQASNPDSVLGRPHMAEHLMKRGYVSSVKEAFDRYLGDDGPYYLPKRRIPLDITARLIREAGGIAVIAHPFQYGYDDAELLRFISDARSAGCTGIEAYYSEHTPGQRDYLLTVAQQYGLLVSGGSDWHGSRKPHIRMGSGIDNSLAVPFSVLEQLRAAL